MLINEVRQWLDEVKLDEPGTTCYNTAVVILIIILGGYSSASGLADECRLETWETKQILSRLKEHGYLVDGKLVLEEVPEVLGLRFAIELSLMCLTVNGTLIKETV